MSGVCMCEKSIHLNTPQSRSAPVNIFLQLAPIVPALFSDFTDYVDSALNFTYACRWRRGVVVSGVGLVNEVNRHQARLVLGWAAACGRVNHLGM